MGKKKKEYKIDPKTLGDNEVILYGSINGWLRFVASNGEEQFMIPDGHTPNDEPAAWYLLGKYRLEETNEKN